MSFISSLASGQTKCLFPNDEPSVVGPTPIDMNPNELKYYPVIIISNKCTGSCNVLYPKACVPKETKHVYVKYLITNKDETKAMTEHISWDCKWKFNSTTKKLNQKWNNQTCEHKF